MGIMDWAQIGQQANPSGYPVNGPGLQPDQAAYWSGNQLQIPGLGALLNVGVSGSGGTGGIPGGGGGGSPVGQLPPVNNSGGSGGSGSNLNQGTINAQYYYDAYPGIYSAYQGLGPDDWAWVEKQGYAPTYGGFAQYHWDTYGQNEGRYLPDWALQGLLAPPNTNTGGGGGGGGTTPPVTPTDPLNPVGRPVIMGGGGGGGLASMLR